MALTFQDPKVVRAWLAGLMAVLVIHLAGCAKETPIPAPSPETDASTQTSTPTPTAPASQDWFLLSLNESGYAQLFAYFPQSLPLTRLTSGAWNDITPALSPDSQQVAFASNRGGNWDLYLLDLQSGETRRLTNTQAYEAAPTWSPDSRWLAYETYVDNNLEIAILSLADPSQPSILLTNDPGADYSPAWAPGGRKVAFVSTRSGDSDIWLADLDRTGPERYTNLSHTPQGTESHPVWSPDGGQLAWASNSFGMAYSGIYVWSASQPDYPAAWIGSGDWPAWNGRGDQLAAILATPNQDYLTIYRLNGDLILQPTLLPKSVRGFLWLSTPLPTPLPRSYLQAAEKTRTPLWFPAVTPIAEGPGGRWAIVPLQDVQAPYPQMHDLVDEAFMALRRRVIAEVGWDVLASLENAFVPLTVPLDPGLGQDWLYTGRAFALNTIIANAGWMVAVRQDFNQQTFWQVYLRTQAQDGSQGEPLHDPPWDLSARYNLDPHAYEQGGRFAQVSPGYWINFTALASAYGWERLPALPNWQTYYNGTRFTEFVLTSSLDWHTAMLDIYPPDVLVTPTAVLPPTRTPTRTPRPTRTPPPTPTPRPSKTPTPMLPPLPTPTPRP